MPNPPGKSGNLKDRSLTKDAQISDLCITANAEDHYFGTLHASYFLNGNI
jgi:hypothetical protein